MGEYWAEDQVYLIEAIHKYRAAIKGSELKKARNLTLVFANELHKATPALHHRSIGAIEQRLPYLDNLLAGVFNKEDYAEKYQHLYNIQPRTDSSVRPNLCNTRHSYKGALKKVTNK
ncbi:hypothetical protein [Fictibacillus barbaricus]|uniref:Uncharacterized protein n=1 Tax=Fictibacillus barbaricus TaxID=182136 RepID=A0ABU1U1E2_9BACL|nr:hypothetical protein [Fictibacillus barbaricus]MDR7073307.1 hypothetical protein [Fictibacillus barbaricus]